MNFSVKDQLGRKIFLNEKIPLRIVSLVPSQTELLFDLGLDKEIIGITKFCIHPKEKVGQKTKIGGTKKLDIEKIKSLQPTLLIANKEENTKEQIEELEKYFPVWVSDVKDLNSALDMICSIGKLTGKEKEANRLNAEISQKFSVLSATLPEKFPAAYFIWKKPMMVAGAGTYINDMLQRCGFKNCFENIHGHYPEISEAQLQQTNPEFILLSSEPFPFKEKHIPDFQKICPQAKILLVDGELFSWYGSRMLKAADYFREFFKMTAL